MPRSKNTALNYIIYSFYAVVIAVIYMLITYFGIFARGVEGYALRTYIWNLLLIVLVLTFERKYLAKVKQSEKKRKLKNKKPGAFYFVSFKASLYLFYMFALIASRLMMLIDSAELGRNMETLHSFSTYLLSIEYGLILLVAADKFIDQFIKDKKQMKEIAEQRADEF